MTATVRDATKSEGKLVDSFGLDDDETNEVTGRTGSTFHDISVKIIGAPGSTFSARSILPGKWGSAYSGIHNHRVDTFNY